MDREVQLFTAGDGFDFICQPIRKNAWRCGLCRRGLLHSWDKKCKVCKHPVILRRSSNRRA